VARFFDKTSAIWETRSCKFIYANQNRLPRQSAAWYRNSAMTIKPPFLCAKTRRKLKELVQADYSLGQRIGVEHTHNLGCRMRVLSLGEE